MRGLRVTRVRGTPLAGELIKLPKLSGCYAIHLSSQPGKSDLSVTKGLKTLQRDRVLAPLPLI